MKIGTYIGKKRGRKYISHSTIGHTKSNLEKYDSIYVNRTEERNKAAVEVELGSEIPKFISDGITNYLKTTGKKAEEIKIVEYGCGVGAYSFQLLEQGYDVEMSDQSEICVNEILKPKLRNMGMDPSRAFTADLLDIPNDRHQRYDICILIGVVYEHEDYNTPRKAYKAVYKSLKGPGSMLIHALNSFENSYLKLRLNRIIMTVTGFFTFIKQPITYAPNSNLIRRCLGRKSLSYQFRHWFYRPIDIKTMLSESDLEVRSEFALDIRQGISEYLPLTRKDQHIIVYGSKLNWTGNLLEKLTRKHPFLFAKRFGVWATIPD
tara:strand:- start:52835 stop:53794 length:960 start_codon:yes stop_codon:yes gene_type:complete